MLASIPQMHLTPPTNGLLHLKLLKMIQTVVIAEGRDAIARLHDDATERNPMTTIEEVGMATLRIDTATAHRQQLDQAVAVQANIKDQRCPLDQT